MYTIFLREFKLNHSIFVVISSSPLPAQTAAELERILALPAVSYGDAAWLILSSAGALPPETSAGGAYGFASDNNWLPQKAAPEAPVTLGGLSLLITQSLNLKGGLMFSLFPNPRYSYRELVYRQVIQGRAYSTQKVSGERLLRILSRALEYSGDTEALAAEEERRRMRRGSTRPLRVMPGNHRGCPRAPREFWSMIMNLFPNNSPRRKTAKLLVSVFFLLLCFPAGSVFAQDFGMTLRSLPVLTNGDEPCGDFAFTGTAIPWFAGPLGEQGAFYLSGGISAELEDEEWKPIPEVFRFEVSYRFSPGLRAAAGRLLYSEPLNLVFNGLADGASAVLDLGKNRLSAGAFYTGLLYKKTAYITMSPGDFDSYYDRENYFASRRLVFSLGWENPGFFDTGRGLVIEMIGQFDLNDEDYTIHSQYMLACLTWPFLKHVNAELGSLIGIIEEGGSPAFCFAASAGLVWLPPGAAKDRFSFNVIFSSGAWNDRVKAFLPVSTIAQGKVLRPKISGLALAETAYTRRLHSALSAEISAAYFFRTDTAAYADPELDPFSRSPRLGAEVYGGLTLAPVSDISFTLGGGVFIPQTGRAFIPDASLRWRVSLGTILSF
jgi:hypothetical protein